MILDKFENISRYKGLNKKLDIGIDFLLNNDLTTLEEGKTIIDGEDIFCIVQEYETKSIEKGKMEAHQEYIDIQCVVSGTELIGYAQIDKVIPINEYNQEKDVQYYKGDYELHTVNAGNFVIYFPSEIHLPSINNIENNVRKVVVKLKEKTIGVI